MVRILRTHLRVLIDRALFLEVGGRVQGEGNSLLITADSNPSLLWMVRHILEAPVGIIWKTPAEIERLRLVAASTEQDASKEPSGETLPLLTQNVPDTGPKESTAVLPYNRSSKSDSTPPGSTSMSKPTLSS